MLMVMLQRRKCCEALDADDVEDAAKPQTLTVSQTGCCEVQDSDSIWDVGKPKMLMIWGMLRIPGW